MNGKLMSILKSVGRYMKEQWEKSHNEWVTKQNMQAQHEWNILMNDLMMRMAIDLYEVFKDGNYNLASITSFKSVRIYRYEIIDGCYQYQFLLTKKNCDRIIPLLLDEMRDAMNRDIKATQHNLYSIYGGYYCYYTYPFLYHDIQVVSVQDYKMSEVIITIQTQLTPQNYNKIYRQIPPHFIAY